MPGISDQSFAEAGAQLVDDAAALYRDADILLKVRRPLVAGEGKLDEMALLRPGQVLVGMLDPYQQPEQVAAYAKAGVIAFALELLPRTTRAQAMDVLSSQANLAGYRAVIDGLAEFDRVMPMLMTAAGTVPPAKVFVIGAGVAGLQAIATARRLGAVVSATDIRPAAKEEIESLGAKFVGVVKQEAATAGGYAKELSDEDKKQQADMVAQHLKSQDLVITTAQIPGRPAPRLVSRAMVESMRPGLGGGRSRGRERRQRGGQPGRQGGRQGRRQDRRPRQHAGAPGAGDQRALCPQPAQFRRSADRPGDQEAGDQRRATI